MSDNIVAVYKQTNPFGRRPTDAECIVPSDELEGLSEQEVRRMAEKAAPDGFHLDHIEGLPREEGLGGVAYYTNRARAFVWRIKDGNSHLTRTPHHPDGLTFEWVYSPLTPEALRYRDGLDDPMYRMRRIDIREVEAMLGRDPESIPISEEVPQ